jgi:hypothetical protein
MYHKLHDHFMAAISMLGLGAGFVATVNVYLQALAFLISIATGALYIWSFFRKRGLSNESEKGGDKGPPDAG